MVWSAHSIIEVVMVSGVMCAVFLLALLVLYLRRAVIVMTEQRELMQFLLLNQDEAGGFGPYGLQHLEGTPMALSAKDSGQSFIRPALLYSNTTGMGEIDGEDDVTDVLVEFEDVHFDDLAKSEQFNDIPPMIQARLRAFQNVIDNLQERIIDDMNPSLTSESN